MDDDLIVTLLSILLLGCTSDYNDTEESCLNRIQALMAVATSATTGRILKKNGWKVNSTRQISKIVLDVKMAFASFDNHPKIKIADLSGY